FNCYWKNSIYFYKNRKLAYICELAASVSRHPSNNKHKTTLKKHMADLHVSKKTVGKLFSEMQNRKFVIPDYQRPYKWNIEKCETLWSDIENFAQTDAKVGADYFLGTIVSYV